MFALFWLTESGLLTTLIAFKLIMMDIKSYKWLIPFCGFLVGYGIAHHFFFITQVEVPLVIGKTVDQVLGIVTERNLTVRLLYYREESEIPQGTILSQIPCAYQKVKPHQSLFVVVAMRPQEKGVPDMRGKSRDIIRNELAALGIEEHCYYLPLQYPMGQCIAQIPMPGESLSVGSLVCYLADTSTERVIWPNLVGKRVEDVKEFFRLHKIDTEVIHTTAINAQHVCSHCLVVNQRPLPGAIINLTQHTQPLLVQLQVE